MAVENSCLCCNMSVIFDHVSPANCCSVALFPIKDWLQQRDVMGDLYRQHLAVRASLLGFLMFSQCVVQGFGVSGFWATVSWFSAPMNGNASSDTRAANGTLVGRTSTGCVTDWWPRRFRLKPINNQKNHHGWVEWHAKKAHIQPGKDGIASLESSHGCV